MPVISDGEPTDAWQAAAERVREGERKKEFALFAIDALGGSNVEPLRRLSVRDPLPLKDYNFRAMFSWLSASLRTVSHSNPGEEAQVKLASPSGWASL